MTELPKTEPTRRTFLKNSTAAVVGSTLTTGLVPKTVHAAGDDIIKVGLIGCGGRGSSAAGNAMRADPNVKVTALADMFAGPLKSTQSVLSRQFPNQYAVEDDHCLVGFDAYKEMMLSDIDVVLLCTPPHFRPAHLKAAVDAGKHVFCEKPVAVDGPGVRSVLETTKKAKEKNLTIVSGLCWRYDLGVKAVMQQIQDGAIGDIQTIQENYLTGGLWHRTREADWTEMEYQVRNWLYFTWLSGDHIVEQHIHSLDKAMWLMGDKPPARCFGLGGRQARTEEKWGHIFDHFAICYEWENGVKTFAFTRQQSGCHNDVEDYVIGTKGKASVLKNHLVGDSGEWKFEGQKPSMYDLEHKALFEGLRSGNIINNGEYMSYSTLMAIMGREACYTGKQLTWDEMMNSTVDLSPPSYEWGDVKIPTVSVPGKA